LSIFPNPSSGRVSFLLTNTVTNDMDITIYDFYGKIVRSVPKKLNQNEIIVDISSLKNGVYIVQVPTGNTLLTKKMVVFN